MRIQGLGQDKGEGLRVKGLGFREPCSGPRAHSLAFARFFLRQQIARAKALVERPVWGLGITGKVENG
jgi:hypothetical protein